MRDIEAQNHFIANTQRFAYKNSYIHYLFLIIFIFLTKIRINLSLIINK